MSIFNNRKPYAIAPVRVIFIVLRGTVLSIPRFLSMFFDWYTDSRYSKHSPFTWNKGLVFHHGFYQAATAIFPQLFVALKRSLGNTPPTIYVTGHSLGGAMAAILNALWNHSSYDLNGQKFWPVHSTYTFGMPRFGVDSTMSALNTERQLQNVRNFPRRLGHLFPYHISNHGDCIPHMPLRSIGYDDSRFEWSSADGTSVDFSMKQNADAAARSDMFHLNFKSHDIDLYIENTGNLVQNGILLQ